MKTGKISGNILKRSVLGQIRNRREEVVNDAGTGQDCAIFGQLGTGIPVVCMQEAPVRILMERDAVNLAFPVFAIGHLIQKCANNLAAAGASPQAVLITLLLPSTEEEPLLRALMAEAEETCQELSMQIAGGQARVTEAVCFPVAVVTGYGVREPAPDIQTMSTRGSVPGVLSGGGIVVSKWIGLEGTALLAEHSRERLLSRYPRYLLEEAAGFHRYLSVLPEARIALSRGVYTMHDASEGGIFGTLWELGERLGVGLSVDLRKLPLRQETVEVCECCNVNPYQLLSGGSLVMVAEDASGLAAALWEKGIPAAVVGKVTQGNDRILLNREEIRYLDRPGQDEVYRYFEEVREKGRFV